MGNWYNIDWEEIPVSAMDDIYINNLLGFVARGGGWSADIVLGCLDELYREARKRGILTGLSSMVLKAHTKRLWKKLAKAEASGKRISWKTPRWIRWILGWKIPFVPYSENKDN